MTQKGKIFERYSYIFNEKKYQFSVKIGVRTQIKKIM